MGNPYLQKRESSLDNFSEPQYIKTNNFMLLKECCYQRASSKIDHLVEIPPLSLSSQPPALSAQQARPLNPSAWLDIYARETVRLGRNTLLVLSLIALFFLCLFLSAIPFPFPLSQVPAHSRRIAGGSLRFISRVSTFIFQIPFPLPSKNLVQTA